MIARDIMTTQVLTVPVETSIKQAMILCVEIGISGLFVVDENQDIIGVVTEKDLLIAYDQLKEVKSPIRDFIKRDIISIKEDTPVETISRILFEKNIIRVPVLREKKIVGVVSRSDILRAVLRQQSGR